MINDQKRSGFALLILKQRQRYGLIDTVLIIDIDVVGRPADHPDQIRAEQRDICVCVGWVVVHSFISGNRNSNRYFVVHTPYI